MRSSAILTTAIVLALAGCTGARVGGVDIRHADPATAGADLIYIDSHDMVLSGANRGSLDEHAAAWGRSIGADVVFVRKINQPGEPDEVVSLTGMRRR